MISTKVVRGGAKHLPLYYTAQEVCEAVAKMFSDMVTCDAKGERVYARLMAMVARGEILPLGIAEGTVVFGLPAEASSVTDRQPKG